MTIFVRIVFGIVLLMNGNLVFANSVAVNGVEPLREQVERLIELKRISSSKENPGLAKAIFFKINDKETLVFVNFTVSAGGNGYREYLAAFSRAVFVNVVVRFFKQ